MAKASTVRATAPGSQGASTGAKQANTTPLLNIETWDDVDRALQEIGECEVAISTIEAELNIAVGCAREKAKNLSDPMKNRLKAIRALVQDFAECSRADMDGKTQMLNFGKVGFRESKSITIPTSKMDAIIKNLRRLNMDDCIIVTEKVSKEALERYSDTEIKKVGASRKAEDKFFLEVDLEKIRR